MYEVAVVGNGLVGSSAARHLSEMGASVIAIGPDEPDDAKTYDGPHGSYFDEGRIARRIDRTVVWSQLAGISIAGYSELESASGIEFHRPVGGLIVQSPAVASGHLTDVRGVARALNIEHQEFDGDAWRAAFPFLAFPPTHSVLFEPGPAGWINPRRMRQAQIHQAKANGAEFSAAVADRIQETPRGVEVALHGADPVRADQVLVATGAYTPSLAGGSSPALASVAGRLLVETETIILAEVDEVTATETLAPMPTVVYLIDDPDIRDVYVVPPLRFPDGRWYVKLGANTSADTWPGSAKEIGEWFRRGDTDRCRDALANAVQALLPKVEFMSMHTKPCIITRTDTGYPFVDRLSDRLTVAVGCNGGGAKAANGIGQVVAGLMVNDSWPDPLDRSAFAVTAADN